MVKKAPRASTILAEDEVRLVTELLRAEFQYLGVQAPEEVERIVRFQPLGHRLREARERLALSIRDLATELKITQSRIKACEQALPSQARPEDLEALVVRLGEGSYFKRWLRPNRSCWEAWIGAKAP